ncbi:ethyl tert-butyl ether degradation protein EthD [Haladaptatus sp. R4]|uniref:EthD family reductase n=1 Tax=Haladaptatus sp. R4 TaxID=1679489 RepID=UPI0007B474DA|nr:EthD family reductase [Haladaptatus sp. R4]KZN23865.1 ethyl tert-butyl ether degradation protein EthD [Haladaptatus sp. R4]
MIKMVDLLVRKDGMSHEEFEEYWLDEHSELAKELPNVKKYVTSVSKDPEKAGYDGVLELYFDSTADMKAAFDSEKGKEVMADAAEFIDMEQGPTLILDETVQLDELN